MTDDTASSTDATEPLFVLRELFLKNVSLEAPNLPGAMFDPGKPELDYHISDTHRQWLEANDKHGEIYEVLLRVTVEAKSSEKALFVIEVEQGGLFEISGYRPGQRNSLLRFKAPEILYPYAREVVSSLAGRGGFPRLHLYPFDFEGGYLKAVEVWRAGRVAADLEKPILAAQKKAGT